MSDPKMRRVIVHWTAGAGLASAKDRQHYHRLIEWNGNVVEGDQAIEDNIVTGDGDYAAHTLRLNTGSIGIALCGMRGAVESPFDPGPSPIREEQFEVACGLIARLCLEHGVPVARETVLTHAEVEPTLGVKQRGKWDISVLPWKQELRGALRVGDHMRAKVNAIMGVAQPAATNRPILRHGDRGVDVAALQIDLADIGYFSGRHDGVFGNLTRAAVLAFQADQGLATDGVVGAMTWTALARADARPPREITKEELAQESGTMADAKATGRVGDLLGAGGVLGAIEIVRSASGAAQEASGTLSGLLSVVKDNWQAFAVVGGLAIAWLVLRHISSNTMARRLMDAQNHRSLSR